MIVIKLMWWLGNQLFQYAIWRALSLEYNMDFVLDTDYSCATSDERMFFRLGDFNIKTNIANNKQLPRYNKFFKNHFLNVLRHPINFIAKKINPNHFIENPKHPIIWKWMFDYNPEIEKKISKSVNGKYLEWFRQSEKYFKKHEQIIRKDFSLKEWKLDFKNQEIVNNMKNCLSVSLHVRRGDYIWSYLDGMCWLEYYKQSIEYLKLKIKNPMFFVFSDDIERCKENLEAYGECKYINWNTWKDSYKDMMLMAQCKHNIIANSTFSRRGARLNENPEKIVIAPTQRHQNLDYADIIPQWRVRL